MWIILTLGIVTAGVGFYEIPQLKKQKQMRELWMFSILLFIGFSSIILNTMNAPIPNPLDFISFVFQPMSSFLFQLLK